MASNNDAPARGRTHRHARLAFGILLVLSCHGAGVILSDRGTDLHLADGEAPRSGDSLWAGGLIEQVIEADVFVAGGGSAGTAAALAAARSGASTVLVNGRAVLGGNSGAEVRVTMVGACGGRGGAAAAMQLDCRSRLQKSH